MQSSGSHFIAYGWIYNSKAYYIHSFVMVIIATIVGLVFRNITFTIFPVLMALVFLLTTALLIGENREISK